jgi:hypothetical protein
MSEHWSDGLPKDACKEAVIWARTQESPQQAWDACERGDWMLWLLGKHNADRKTLVLAACRCARLALKYVPKGEERPLQAIETAEKWARGVATIEEVRRDASTASAATSAADAAACAARAAADASSAADAAACAARAAADASSAADAAACAAADASFVAAYNSILLEEAKIVRKYFPKYPLRKALKRKEKV